MALPGNLRSAPGKFTIQTPESCSCFTSETCHPSEGRARCGFNYILSLLPPRLTLRSSPLRANGRKHRALSGAGLPSRGGRKQKPEPYGCGAQGNRPCPPWPRSPLCICIASPWQFAGSPRSECQGGGCDRVRHTCPGLSVLTREALPWLLKATASQQLARRHAPRPPRLSGSRNL